MSSAELAIAGMTCASCAARVEKKLNRLDGVTATVNFATETARVTFPATVSTGDLISVVEQAGYTAALPAPPETGQAEAAGEEAGTDELAPLRQRLLVSVALTVPVVLMAMVPALQFRNWQWASLALASPVAVWGAWPFHRAALVNARHGAATMDTLISVGVTAAYLWSLYALFFGTAGWPGTQMGFAWLARGSGAGATYLEVASGVTALSLLGMYVVRYLEVYPSLYGEAASSPFGLWEIGILLGFAGVWGTCYLAFMNAFPRMRVTLMTSPYRDEVQVPVDAETLRYLEFTGRPPALVRLVEAYCKEQGLFHTAATPEAEYSDALVLDLQIVEPSLAGPTRPQDRVPLSQGKKSFGEALTTMLSRTKSKATSTVQVQVGPKGETQELHHGSVVIAAITSCTNTSNPSVMMAAGLLANVGARVTITSRKPEQGEKARQFISARFNVHVDAVDTGSQEFEERVGRPQRVPPPGRGAADHPDPGQAAGTNFRHS